MPRVDRIGVVDGNGQQHLRGDDRLDARAIDRIGIDNQRCRPAAGQTRQSDDRQKRGRAGGRIGDEDRLVFPMM